jgi:hypothetical protein
MTATTLAPEPTGVRVGTDAFFVWMAFACVAIAFGGFATEYWIPLAGSKVVLQPIYHVHGLVASAWTLFLFLQSSLIASKNTRRHREFGLAGVSLATLLVGTGLLLAITAMQNHARIGDGPQYMAFSIVPITVIGFFAVCVGLALAYAKRRETHKRLMLLGTFFILEAAVGRVFKLFLAPPEVRALPLLEQPAPPIMLANISGAVCFLLVVVAAVYDWRTRGKPHPVWIWGGLVMVALLVLRGPISTTPAWQAVANAVLSLAG